jgi:hypothetical protein
MDAGTRRALDVLNLLITETEARWGDVAVDVQQADAAAVLDTSSPVRNHWLGRARGYSKTSDVAGMSLAAMLTQLPPGAAMYAAAADRDQGRLLADAVRGYVQRTPELAGAVDVQATRITALRSGVVLEILPADAASAWGLRPHWLVCDELANWADVPNSRNFYLALTTALPKVPGSRLVIMTSAGDPAHFSRREYETALAEPDLWRVSDITGPAPWIPARRIEAERRRLLPSQFARLFENIWTAPEDALVHPDDLAACVTLDGDQQHSAEFGYVAALDVGVTDDRTALVVCHAEPVGGDMSPENVRVVLDRILVWTGSRAEPVDLDTVATTALDLCREFRCSLVYDPSQAVYLAQRLRSRGVPAEQFTFTAQSVGTIATALFTLLRAHHLALPQDAELLDELAHVRLRTNSAGVVRVDHASGRHDDRAVALGMAARWLLDNLGGGPEFPVLPDRPGEPGENIFGVEVLQPLGNFAYRPAPYDAWLDASGGSDEDDTVRRIVRIARESPFS